jgi:predicted dehydrogenase
MATSPNDAPAPVRLAVIGAGVIGRKHLEKIAAESAAELVAIADPAPGAAELAAQYSVPLFAGAEAMLRAEAPDGVIVATPTEYHLAPVLAALDHGTHVLVEKPIAAADAEAAQIVARAAAAGRHVLTGHHRRYYPVLARAREILAAGEIGDLVTVHGHWTVLKEGRGYWDPDWRKRRGAGPVLTNLIHEFDTLRFICGEIASVQAEITSRLRGWEKEDAAAITLTFANGALGTFVLSDGSPSPWAWELATGENPAFPPTFRNTHRLTGTAGAMEFPDLALWRQSEGTGWHHAITRHAVPVETADAYARQCAHFCAVIRGEEAPIISAGDGARTLRAVTAVFEAAESGRRVVL